MKTRSKRGLTTGHLATWPARIPVTAMRATSAPSMPDQELWNWQGAVMALKNPRDPDDAALRPSRSECRLNVVREPMRDRNPVAMSVNRTRVGQSVAAVLRAI